MLSIRSIPIKAIALPLMLLFLIALTAISISAASLTTPSTMESLNSQLLPSENNAETTFSFILAGHAYGAPDGGRSVFPAASFCAGIPLFLDVNPAFIALLGDAYWWESPDIHADNLVRVLEQLPFPVFNAPGNHEGDREQYAARFGPTYGKVRFGPVLLIFLDTDLTAGEIQGDQLAFFVHEMEVAGQDNGIKAVFVLSHRLIWAPALDWTDIVFQHVNSRSGYAEGESFRRDIYPVLTALAQRKPVYWISGDVGVSWSLPLFWEKDPGSNATFAACGLGDTERDAAILITVDKRGNIEARALSLTGQQLLPLASYNTEYWRAFFAGEQSQEQQSLADPWYTAVARLVISVVHRKTFYAGVIGGGLSMASFIWFAFWMRRTLHR